ncbi:hypothetical protein [Pseudovibrio sp. Ad26]|uniref:hypothetical protein n=1 Tax=Pseudovibrio sp. Ad26 TaxID=989410 RepID=UPI0007AEA902|nr:hypothetical protein [Pseudovibrio sp. Ad26]KZL06178.1 hypothetical protein PsAD26_03939 [Pseudovibrio sp. Ad26]
MDTSVTSKRAKVFCDDMIKEIPRFPNDKESLNKLKNKSLTDLLVLYISWRLRHVGTRSRSVAGREALAGDPRAVQLKPNIDTFLKAVENGKDLTPYLSIKPRTQGYSPDAETGSDPKSSWLDKDFLLNVMGLHHFHLGMIKEKRGHMARTSELLFASVTRDTFEILGLFDHSAFEYEDDGSMTCERKKIWSVYEAQQNKKRLLGQLMIGGYQNFGITMSAHPMAVVRAAQEHARIIEEVDPKLDDLSYVQSLFPEVSSLKEKLKWHYKHLDFGLLHEKSGTFGVLSYGPN